MAPASEREWVRPVFWLVLGLITGTLLHAFWTRERATPPPVATAPAVSYPVPPAQAALDQPEVIAPAMSALDSLRASILAREPIELSPLLIAADQFSIADCEELLLLCAELPEYEGSVLWGAAARRWAALDPEGLFAALPSRRTAKRWTVLAQAAASELARRDLESLVTKLDTTDIFTGPFLRRILVEELAKVNPWRAAEVASVQRDFIRDNDLYQIVSRHLARQSPQQALEWANSLWQPYARLAATHEIWKTWATEDPAAVAAELARNPPDSRTRSELINDLSTAWSRKDPNAAIAWIRSLPAREQEKAWSRFRPQVNLENASEMLEHVLSIDSPEVRRNIANSVAVQLASEGHSKAIEWAKNLPPEDQAGILPNIAIFWAQNDARAAGDYILTLPENESRTRAIGHVVGRWAQLEPEAALAWAAEIPSASEREAAARNAVNELHHYTPESAMRWIDLVENPEKRADISREIVSRWAQVDGAAAAQWVASSAEANANPEAYYAVARQWAFVQPEATEEWMAALPVGAHRDSAIDAYVSSMDGYDPGLATQWAATIQDPQNQARATSSAFRRWMQKDAEAARAWLEQTPLPDSVRADLAPAAQQPQDTAHAHSR